MGGVQQIRRAGHCGVVADIAVLLAQAGIDASSGDLAGPLAAGVTLFDATTDEHLAAVAVLGRAATGRVLWCGSAGLAQALAGSHDGSPTPSLSGRVLGLFGSDQAVTARQLASCGDGWLRLRPGEVPGHRVSASLERDGAAMVSLDLSTELTRADAARRIAAVFTDLVRSVERPSALLVAGGETLRGLCDALGTSSLEVRGQFEPGLPHSVMRGGLWDGVTVVSKSGAFGGPALWRNLLADHGHHFTEDPTERGRQAEGIHA